MCFIVSVFTDTQFIVWLTYKLKLKMELSIINQQFQDKHKDYFESQEFKDLLSNIIEKNKDISTHKVEDKLIKTIAYYESFTKILEHRYSSIE